MMEVFQMLGQYFDQDIFVIYPSVQDATSAFLSRLDISQIDNLSSFLEKQLASKTNIELGDVWSRTGSDILVPEDSIRGFLEKILMQVKEYQNKS